jgi:alkylation response protein AidB-like acyl-CoA dehydrogenase
MSLFTEEHRLFRDSIKKFVEAEITPHVDQWENQSRFPSDIFKKLGAAGFLGILLPEEFGGVGGDYALAGSWCEEFARVPSVGFTTAVNMHSLVISPTLAKFGSQKLKESWLPGAIQGDLIGAYAFTEPNAGSDLSQIETTAVKDGKNYVLNGSKIFITNGKRANFVLVLAKTDKSAGYKGFTTFLVDTKSDGFSCPRTLNKLGWHASDTAELVFDSVKVPEGCVLGEVGKGWSQAMGSLEWERLMLTLNSLGGASKCLEDTLTYVKDRKMFGKTLSQFGNTKEVLTLLQAKLQAGRAMTYKALGMLQSGDRCRKEVSLAKYYVCELAIEVADRCLQLHGGYGYTTEFKPERWLRDLRLNTIGGGTSEIMLRVAAGEIFS